MSAPKILEDAVKVAKTAQIMAYVKDNQVLTALALFVMWQAGAFVYAYSTVQGAMC